MGFFFTGREYDLPGVRFSLTTFSQLIKVTSKPRANFNNKHHESSWTFTQILVDSIIPLCQFNTLAKMADNTTNKALIPVLVTLMLLTGVCNTLLTKYQVN
jgi:hypothetical protein